ncbi:carbohydrate ABC transporter permease [Paenibacillus sp. IB182496]|uniref:Carbohydrate ABC transporter permease n=1 Tax=Paenibacillus sabuli TaxID=2772509 RepID=A0A927BW48_9BACL|nr:carbohydrate ABC transporter permease [Paenibacillus sabuli]MBD2847417.1 carbohydrate ABC transporter permease [Paenibacillus sabuli]
MPAIRRRLTASTLGVHLFFVLFSLSFLIPFILVISISLTSEERVLGGGYSLLPIPFDLTAYKVVFQNPSQIMSAYAVTAFQAALGTFLSVFVMSLCAYPLSRQSFRWRGPITFYIFFTMLFGGGLIPSYILITQYLKLGDTVWVYILPTLANAFHIIIFRTFFQGLPQAIIESAKMDGANELRIYFRMILPLSKPVLATLALLGVLGRWNEWFIALIYIRDQQLYTLQYLLQKILMEAEFIRQMATEAPAGIDLGAFTVPTETVRFALAIVAAGPLLVVFPFFQKYFARGLTIGSVKG